MAHPRIVNAFRAMKALGISEDRVKPVLKRLLKLYNKNWDPIEEDNYRALIEAIFDHVEPEAAKREISSKNAEEGNLEEEEVVHEEPERPLKRQRLRQQDGQPSPSSLGRTSQVRHDVDGAELLGLPNSSNGHMDSEPQPAPCQQNNGKQPVSPNAVSQETYSLSQLSGADKSQPSACAAGTGLSSDRGKEVLSPLAVSAEKSSSEPSNPQSSNKKLCGHHALIKPKEEPVTEDVHQEVHVSGTHAGSAKKDGSPNANGLISNGDQPLQSKVQSGARLDSSGQVSGLTNELRANDKLENITDKSSTIEVASSTSGEVKVILNCSATLAKPNFEMPSLDAVVKLMEDKYKDLDPKFSVIKVMQDVCQCLIEFGAESNTNHSSINGSEATRDE